MYIIKYLIPSALLLSTFILISTKLKGERGDYYQQSHKEMVGRFDLDGDGFLDREEREKMRATPKPAGKQFKRGREKKRVRRDMPGHWIEKYDKDGDGGLSDNEAGMGYRAELKRLFMVYDTNKNDRLDPEETARLAGNIEAGKYASWDHSVANETLKEATRDDSQEKRNLSRRQRAWLREDLDGDGRASEEEIATIRNKERK